MNQLELNAKLREDMGKGASRRLRRAGKLPGVVYGAEKDATSITLEHDDVVHKLEQEAFYSSILTLKIGKSKDKVVLKDLQRHPYKPFILHLDLLRISESEKLTMRVPIHFINEDKCVGVKEGGGIISHVLSEFLQLQSYRNLLWSELPGHSHSYRSLVYITSNLYQGR